MLVVVRERTREIGIQRALGAKPFNIISQIMLESVSLTLVAGVIGLSLGVGLLELISRAMAGQTGEDVFFRNPEISFTMAVAALIVLLLAGLFAGSIPAKRAISIKPIDAIRDEG
jgi:putative ABC transport system permease protein